MATRSWLKRCLENGLSQLTGRHVVVLPAQAGSEPGILNVEAPYRVEGDKVTLNVRENCSGTLAAMLLGFEGHFPTLRLWTGDSRRYNGPSEVRVDLSTGMVLLNEHEWGRFPAPFRERRFSILLEHSCGRVRKSRMTGHYRAVNGGTPGKEYFYGSNYVDHDAQSVSEAQRILGLLGRHPVHGPLLEVGCATGLTLGQLRAAGHDVIGIDISEWAVTQARESVGPESAFVCDASTGTFPPAVLEKAPFGGLIFWAVLEHFAEPYITLERLTALTTPGARLFVSTTNADSLMHALFGREWEGYFDWTHEGVDVVSPKRMRAEFSRLGWSIDEMETFLIWDSNTDPTRASFRDWYIADARLRQFIRERELGDLVDCAATRR